MKQALGFLMTREIAQQNSFEKAIYAISPNFPPGMLPGMPKFTSVTSTCPTAATAAQARG